MFFWCFVSFAKEWNRVLCADISVYYATKLFHNGVVSDSDRAFGQGNWRVRKTAISSETSRHRCQGFLSAALALPIQLFPKRSKKLKPGLVDSASFQCIIHITMVSKCSNSKIHRMNPTNNLVDSMIPLVGAAGRAEMERPETWSEESHRCRGAQW